MPKDLKFQYPLDQTPLGIYDKITLRDTYTSQTRTRLRWTAGFIDIGHIPLFYRRDTGTAVTRPTP